MREEKFDIIIAGLGAMGSAAAYHLSRRGMRVLGLDAFDPPHTLGSSHGETRVIREAYFEDPVYVPLVQRAYELWAELERNSGAELYRKTGGLMIGAADSDVVEGAIRSAREHRLQHEVLSAAEIETRFPGLRPGPQMMGVLEPRAGILFPEKCIEAHLHLAKKFGSTLRTNEPLLRWGADDARVQVQTAAGSYSAGKLILSGGAWLPQLMAGRHEKLFGKNPPLQIERQVLLWFKPRQQDLFRSDRFPIHLWEYEKGKMFYGFPDSGNGLKVALHHQGERTHPDTVDRTIRPSDIAILRDLLARFVPEGNGDFLRGTVCLYTNTPDGHFLLDTLSQCSRVIVASPCSGHGFKFASAIGEVLADLAMEKSPRVSLERFSFSRFTA